jgi:hypothetical protein
MSDLVQFQNTVKVHIKISKIIEDVCKTLSELPDFNTKLRLDPEIIVYCCNIVEQLIKKEDKQEIHKLDLVSTILTKAWDIKEDSELDLIIKQIKFVCNNNQVKKISKSKKIKKYIKDWIIKKLA